MRPGWGGGKLNAVTTLLEPLSDAESAELVDFLGAELDEGARRRVVEAAGGNPLFVEEMLALLHERGDGDAVFELPPTIQALLAARLDRLPDDERRAVEAAAVEGQVFHEGSVAKLTALPQPAVRRALQGLLRKDLVGPARAAFAGNVAYRFRHLLIRDAAYESIPKSMRSTLHERHANWLERMAAGERALEFEEILGYHLEQAFRYRSDLGLVDGDTHALGGEAGRRLGAAGRRALARGDARTAVKLLSRAASLLPVDDPLRVHLVPGVRSVQGMADELDWAEAVLEDALATGDPALVPQARVQGALLRLFTKTRLDVAELVEVATDAIGVFEAAGDELGQARAWRLLQQARYLERHSAASADAAEQGLIHAQRADDPVEEGEILAWLGITFFMGATPAREGERRARRHLERVRGSRAGEALLFACLGPLVAMQGRFDEAHEILERASAMLDDHGLFSQQLAAVPIYSILTEIIVGDLVAAERRCRTTLEPLEAIGDTSNYCAVAAMLARVLYEQGRYAEAEELTHLSERTSHLNDVFAHITWRAVRAKTLARRGEMGKSLALARDAIEFASVSDFLNTHADALLDLADVLELAHRPDEAVPAVENAIALYERKGNVVSAQRARTDLERLAAAVSGRS